MNRPHATEARTHSRDGHLYDGRHKGAKNYEPNSFGGPFQTDRPLWRSVPVSGGTVTTPPRSMPRTTTSCRRAPSTG